MGTPIPPEEQGLSDECRLLLREIRRLMDQVSSLRMERGEDLKTEVAEDGQLIVMMVNAGSAGRPVSEIAEAFGADEYGHARCNASLDDVISAAERIHDQQRSDAQLRSILNHRSSRIPLPNGAVFSGGGTREETKP